jgi:hypothetical protein
MSIISLQKCALSFKEVTGSYVDRLCFSVDGRYIAVMHGSIMIPSTLRVLNVTTGVSLLYVSSIFSPHSILNTYLLHGK